MKIVLNIIAGFFKILFSLIIILIGYGLTEVWYHSLDIREQLFCDKYEPNITPIYSPSKKYFIYQIEYMCWASYPIHHVYLKPTHIFSKPTLIFEFSDNNSMSDKVDNLSWVKWKDDTHLEIAIEKGYVETNFIQVQRIRHHIRQAFGITYNFSKRLFTHFKVFDLTFFYINYGYV